MAFIPINSNTVTRPNAAHHRRRCAQAHHRCGVMPTLPQGTKAVAPTVQPNDLTREFHRKPLQQIYVPVMRHQQLALKFSRCTGFMSATFVHVSQRQRKRVFLIFTRMRQSFAIKSTFLHKLPKMAHLMPTREINLRNISSSSQGHLS